MSGFYQSSQRLVRMHMYKKFSQTEIDQLRISLLYMNMTELRCVSRFFHLPPNDTKLNLIERILLYVSSGIRSEQPRIPDVSRGTSKKNEPLMPHQKMLYGIYKNDAKTRAFFKQILGEDFHFTAFGIDWLKDRWMKGNPPTYQEFADFWRAESQRRNVTKEQPKEEWAYFNFTQDFLRANPNASQAQIIAAWKSERKKHVEKAYSLIGMSSFTS